MDDFILKWHFKYRPYGLFLYKLLTLFTFVLLKQLRTYLLLN
jgi:hypothetical protein